MSSDIKNVFMSLNMHLLENPISANIGASIKLKLKNKKYFEINNMGEEKQPSFTLTIDEPISCGLEGSEQHNVDKFIDNVILACNIFFKRAVFSKYKSDINRPTITFKEQESTSKVYDTPTGKAVEIHESCIRVTDDPSVSLGTRDELDEDKVLEILSKIKKMQLSTVNSLINLHNFQKSLNEYINAMDGVEKISVFKHLFSSLEFAANCDNGPDRSGVSLDSYVSNITGISASDIAYYRNFNSRAKHKDQNSNQEQLYREGLLKLSNMIKSLRNTTQTLIQTRFNDIS